MLRLVVVTATLPALWRGVRWRGVGGGDACEQWIVDGRGRERDKDIQACGGGREGGREGGQGGRALM